MIGSDLTYSNLASNYSGNIYYYFGFTHHAVNGLYVFLGVFCYVPYKEGADLPAIA